MSLTPSFAQAAILAKPLLSAVFTTQSKGKALVMLLMEIYTNGDEQRMAMKIEHGIALQPH
jgi:hypothetical protein